MLAVTICILELLHMSAACGLTGLCTDQTSVQQEIVDVHNAYRRAVEPAASNMLKMSWSDAVARSAQGWIDQCDMTHGPPSSRMIDGYEMGENLFKASTVHSWTDVINAWHSEVNNYDYPTGSTNGLATGHYTQVVWYSSYEVGCAAARCGSYYFYGCHYYRAGNFKRVPPYSTGEPCASCPDDCEDGLCANPCPYVDAYRNCDSLKERVTCDDPLVSRWCPASCRCEDKIVPIAKK
ncbi:cysteine-rich venom protein ENH1 [Puntigrus tetrazona]|uniref:cysteine-rich venom protein ENH1 n=1 Tax=Puntigrus tetrazona TaxID=1606681 RepID=UPI001C8A1B9B|nr:cysteine-rich venom protein ENH1 [Puntigrus tetrazona]XP_043087760.1 cysteine-rich venom protein ENH1 [Puntigrus tetrazona]XP_043087761.1 cysteine-rich venom protein ENH1 [Puntigrus tetrazona]